MINIAAVVLLIAFPLSAIGVDFNHHICTTKHVHIVSLFGTADCGGHPAAGAVTAPAVKLRMAVKEEPVPSCCHHKKPVPERELKTVNGSKACSAMPKKDCCSPGQQQPANGPRLEKENCCKNYVERLSVGEAFYPAATDNTVLKDKIDCEGPVSTLTGTTDSVELFKYARQKIPKPDCRLIAEHIVSFIHYASSGS